MTKLFLAAALALGLTFAGASAEAMKMGHKGKFRHAHSHNVLRHHGHNQVSTCVPNAAGFCTQPHI